MAFKPCVLLARCFAWYLALSFISFATSEEQLCYMEFANIEIVQQASMWRFEATTFNSSRVRSEFRLVGSKGARDCKPTAFNATEYGAALQKSVEDLAEDECVSTISDNLKSTQTLYIEEKQFSLIDNCKMPNGDYNRRRILCAVLQTDLTIQGVRPRVETAWVNFDSACTGPCIYKDAEHKVELVLAPNDVVYTTGQHVFVGTVSATISPTAYLKVFDNASWFPLNPATDEPMTEHGVTLVVGGEATWDVEMSDDKSGFQFEITYVEGQSTPKYAIIGDLKLIPTFEDNPYRRWISKPVRDLMRMITNRRSDETDGDEIVASPFRRDFAVLAPGPFGPTPIPENSIPNPSPVSHLDSAPPSDSDSDTEASLVRYITLAVVIAILLCVFALVVTVATVYCCYARPSAERRVRDVDTANVNVPGFNPIFNPNPNFNRWPENLHSPDPTNTWSHRNGAKSQAASAMPEPERCKLPRHGTGATGTQQEPVPVDWDEGGAEDVESRG